ncbi:MAG TPA: hypothetical protein VLF71_01555 [Candidatus Saccharimonadales bacterium]|nr:hypothetical protein [Candidatus Saccharimonadales bacterium]
MEPNANQPGADGQVPGGPQMMPPGSGGTSGSDWQKGLGGPAQMPPAPGNVPGAGAPPSMPGMAAPGPQPMQPGVGAPGGMPNMGAPTPVMGGAGGDGMMGANAPKKKPTPMLVLAGLLVLLAIVAAAFFLFGGKKHDTANNAAKKSSGTATASAVDLGTLNTITFSPPADLSAFDANSVTQANAYSYNVKGATADKACNLSIAIVTAVQLPGADTNAIVAPQIDALRKAGATVDGPNAGKVLLLKSTDGKAAYSMPTLTYEFTEGSKHASVHYSVVILKDTTRAQIARQCISASGPTDTAQMATMDEAATHITVSQQ